MFLVLRFWFKFFVLGLRFLVSGFWLVSAFSSYVYHLKFQVSGFGFWGLGFQFEVSGLGPRVLV